MTFSEATASYEAWLSQELEIVPADLTLKHQTMRAAIFSFFRATFYRWAQIWPQICPQCAKAPQILAVGDLHVENFGTWRDAEGRLVWGINDFDEVCRMPYTIDLVRLAASAHLAIDTEQLHVPHRDACAAILSGYRESIAAGGLPFVLGGKHPWLFEMVKPSLRDPAVFWQKLDSLPPLPGRVPGNARRGIEKMMPGKSTKWRVAHRVAGMGSLGRQRFVAIAEYRGGLVCREAKALAPSAWDWAREDSKAQSQPIRYQRALDIAVRDVDPWVRLQGNWIVRRLAPDCSKINLAMFPRERDETRLLHAMGWETANLHLGSGRIDRVTADLEKRPPQWLHKAAAKMVAATKKDWKEWQAASGATPHVSIKT
jgi:Ser/Thr protein kinase RdoA (MazF antagonist)